MEKSSKTPIFLNVFNNPSPREAAAATNAIIDLSSQPDDIQRPENNANGESPESGSLYSDGYNSGEQYDTLSTGYMSGEAYELPDTRMELHEPALDIIEECIQPLDAKHDESDSNIFVLPPGCNRDKKDIDVASISSSSTEASNNDVTTFRSNIPLAENANADLVTKSPNYGSIKSKLRKKVTTFAIPIENSPLSAGDKDEDYGFDPESSDPGAMAATGGYRAFPSDTDTSAFDSDANAIMSTNTDGTTATDSGTELLHASLRNKTKADRLAIRKAKRMRRHDEEWFNSNDSKRWKVTRQICFWFAIGSMLASTVCATVLIILMPRQCEPAHEWYQGGLIMDVAPSQSPNGWNTFNLKDLESQLDSIKSLGATAIRLRNLTNVVEKQEQIENYRNIFNSTSKKELEEMLVHFFKACHQRQLYAIVELFVANTREDNILSGSSTFAVTEQIEFWAPLGVDGLHLAGLEQFKIDSYTKISFSAWRAMLDRNNSSHVPKSQRILITSFKFAKDLFDSNLDEDHETLSQIDLLDADLSFEHHWDASALADEIMAISSWDAIRGRPWVNWNMHFLNKMPLHAAALSFQIFLPGTISVSYPNQTLESTFRNLTHIRTIAVPIFMNGNYKRCACPEGTDKEGNFILKEPLKQVLQVERFYSRRNRYVLIANFADEGSEPVELKSVANVYSGGILMMDSANKLTLNENVKMEDLKLEPGHALVIQLPK